MSVNGIIELSSQGGDNLLASKREPRTKNVVIKGGQGILRKGTLMQKGSDGKYVICTDPSKMEGVLFEDVDTGSSSATTINHYVVFDVDLNASAVISGATSLPYDFYPNCGINIK